MAKLPRTPRLDRLQEIEPALITLDSDTRLHRIYKRGGPYPTYWNTFRYYGPLTRFDHHFPDPAGNPEVQERGILYAARDIPTAVAETFQRNRRRVNRHRDQPWLVAFSVRSQLRLLDLTDTFCVRAGASAKLFSGPFAHAQNWSRGFYDAYSAIHGLYYLSSLTNRPAVALYERAAVNLFPASTRLHRALADPLLLEPLRIVVEEIGYRLL